MPTAQSEESCAVEAPLHLFHSEKINYTIPGENTPHVEFSFLGGAL